MHFSFSVRDPWGDPTLSVDQATSDRPDLRWRVLSADGASPALENPLNRVRTGSRRPGVAMLVDDGEAATTAR